MKEMTKRERVEAALNLRPVDRVPVYDLLVNDAAIEYYAAEPLTIQDGFRTTCKAISRCLDLTRSIRGPAEPMVVDHGDGWVHRYDRWTTWIVERPFQTPEQAADWMERSIGDMDALKPGSEDREQFHKDFLNLQALCGDTVLMHSLNGVGIDALYHTVGWDPFACILADQPELISAWLESHTNHQVRWIHACSDYELSPVALTFGDIACKGTTLFSPAWLRREFMPRLKRINDALHEHGIKCMFHSDGYLMDVLADLIEANIDGLNPIEVCAGMSVKEVKDLYGDRLFIAGGIDVSQLLPLGKLEEVRAACEQAIRDTGGIGFLMGSTTELHNAVPLENFRALVEIAWTTPLPPDP
jgi:uroporphyrinogen decarboxylase